MKDSNLQPLPKKQFRFEIKRYIPAMLFATLIGTYLDLIFVGRNVYSFPIRPFSSVFSINIAFTLAGLPTMTFIFLLLIGQFRILGRFLFILLMSVLMSIMEKKAEVFGMFEHTRNWNHHDTFIGYCFYFIIVYIFHKWFEQSLDHKNKTKV